MKGLWVCILVFGVVIAHEQAIDKSSKYNWYNPSKCDIVVPCYRCTPANMTLAECERTGYIMEYNCKEESPSTQTPSSSSYYIGACRKPIERREDSIPLINCIALFYGGAVISTVIIVLYRNEKWLRGYLPIRTNKQ